MSHSCRMVFTIASAAVLAITVFDGTASTQGAVSSDPIPSGPYRRIEPWGQLPAGMKWAAVIGAEPGPDGNIYVSDDTIFVADSESWGPDNPGWKKGIRIGSAKDGSVKYFIEDIESTVTEHSGAEGVGVDARGNVYGAVVRRRMLEKHEKR